MPFFTVCLSVCPILWWHKRCLTHGTLSVPNQAQKSGIIWCSFPKLCYNIGMLQNWMRKLYVFHCFWCCPAQRPFAFLMVGHLMHNCSMSCAKKAFFSFISPKCAVLLQNSDKLCNVNYYSWLGKMYRWRLGWVFKCWISSPFCRFASITINLGPTFLSGALAANSESHLNKPSCPLIQGPFRHYVLNVLWIFINLLCVLLTMYHLYKLYKDLSR